MKTLSLKTAKIKSMFNQLQKSLGGTLSTDSKESILEIENEIGRGVIRGVTFKGGISCLEFDMKFSEDFAFVNDSSENSPICFAYCSKGHMEHSFGIDGKKRKLDNFQTAILTSKPFQENVIYFKKEINLKTTLIVVNTQAKIEAVKKKTLNYKLQKIFVKEDGLENYMFISSYNLKIAEKIQELSNINEKGLVRSLLLEGLVHMILALEIKQHSEDIENSAARTYSLNTREMDTVKELSNYIQSYSERQLSVTELCQKSGLSPSKLQEGFKFMHGVTVANYLREVRVRKAEDLIKNTDLNISEVVYSIGFTSRSYFSKIFKAKYNCSPKQYKDNQYHLMTAI